MNSFKNLFKSTRIHTFDPVANYIPLHTCDKYVSNRVYPIIKCDTMCTSFKYDSIVIKSNTFICPIVVKY